MTFCANFSSLASFSSSCFLFSGLFFSAVSPASLSVIFVAATVFCSGSFCSVDVVIEAETEVEAGVGSGAEAGAGAGDEVSTVSAFVVDSSDDKDFASFSLVDRLLDDDFRDTLFLLPLTPIFCSSFLATTDGLSCSVDFLTRLLFLVALLAIFAAAFQGLADTVLDAAIFCTDARTVFRSLCGGCHCLTVRFGGGDAPEGGFASALLAAAKNGLSLSL